MIKWGIIGTFMAIAWFIQARVNEHDRLAKQIFDTFDFLKVYRTSGAQFFGDSPEDLRMGEKTFQIRSVSLLKDRFKHRQMRKILREHSDNRVAAQTMMVETREEVKLLAKQVAKSYAALTQSPNADVAVRRRRRRR